jgi:hypothetical protein
MVAGSPSFSGLVTAGARFTATIGSVTVTAANAGTTGRSHPISIGNLGVAAKSNAIRMGTIPSSRRFKENIKEIDSDIPLMELRPVSFNYIGDESEQWGLIAEEVVEKLPNLVIFDDDGLPGSVAYHCLPVLLLNELQKQKKAMDAMARSIIDLYTQLE